jgi:hypothetical protein
MSCGITLIVLGGLVTQTQYVGYLTPGEVWTIWITHVPLWPMWIAQILQSVWGTNKMNNLVINGPAGAKTNLKVAGRAGAPGAAGWKENFVALAHVAAATMIFGWAVIVKALIYPRESVR